MKSGLSEREVECLCQVFRRHAQVIEVLLFGSRAMGTHSASSDIDLAVRGEVSELEAEGMAAELDELPLPYRFDVIPLSRLRDAAVRDHIERVGETLYRAGACAK